MVIPGETVISGKYAVLELLGKGGMGQVFKVQHASFQTQLAIKTLLPRFAEEEKLITRFKEEARKNHSLSNPQNPDPNIVQVIDVDFDPTLNLRYYVMEYIEGKTLSQILREQRTLPLSDILEIAEKVGRALAKAHNLPKPMIHRDISPANIMIEDRSRRIVVMDFGIAKEEGEEGLTEVGVVIGKPKYCSPEQIRHELLNGSADIYSLGMVVYELYTGKQFFAGIKDRDVIEQVLYDPKENIPSFDPPAPQEFVALVTRAIAKSQVRRYQRVEEFLQAVNRCRSGLSEATGEKTIVFPPPIKKPEDTEERRRKLEEELRLLSLDFQGRARTTREQAEEEGAHVLAATLFQQGQAKEAHANHMLDDRNHSRAQEAYGEAVALFARASEATQQATEHARKEMETVKAEAERYRARTTQAARRFYTDGLMAEGQARELLDDKRYQHAHEQYVEAQRAFTDARDVAHETLRGEIEAARQQTEALKDAARDEGAERLAAALFQEAVELEEQAARVAAQEEFTQAARLYTAACQNYADARQNAHSEQQRQLALTVQQQVRAARQLIEAQEKAYLTLPSYGAAAEAQRQGDEHLAAHEYDEAVQAYEHAQQEYAQAEQEARHMQRQRAADAHQHLQEIRNQAAEVGGKERFAQRWTEAEQLAARGAEHGEHEDFLQARQWYEQGAQQFEQLRREAEAEAARERAQAARQHLAEIEQELESLTPWAGPQWHGAQEYRAQADRAWQAQQYEKASEHYQQAARHYQDARREAETERQRQHALSARQQGQKARAAAEHTGAPQDAQTLYQQAEELWQRGEQSLTEQQWEQAATIFAEAQRRFTEALAHAEQEQARQAAVEARTAAFAARQAAAAGEQLFPAPYQEAAARLQQAEQALADGHYDAARATFIDSTNSFQQLRQAVHEYQQREKLRQEAEAAQARAGEAQQAALTEGAAELVPDAFQHAERSVQEAATLLLREEFAAAQQGFVAARQQYEVAQQQARQERRHRAALAARDQAEAAQRQATEEGAAGLAPATYQQAVAAQQEGDQQLTAEAYEQATQQYTRARAGFVRALREARQERRRRKAAAREQATATRQRIAELKGQLAPLSQWWGATQPLATQRETTAEQEWGTEQYEQAAAQYEAALQAYETALQEAQTIERACQAATTARTQAAQARQAAEEAQASQYAPAPLQEAITLYTQGERQFQAKEWGAATSSFSQTRDLFAHAQQQAGEAKERAHQAAEAARRTTSEARQTAEDGALLFPDRWRAVEELCEQAEQALGTEQYGSAQQLFTDSTVRFQQLAQAVQDHKHREELKQAAEAAQAQAETVRRQTLQDEAEQFAADAFAQAEQQLQQAATALQNEQFTQARTLFDEARQQYSHAQRQAQVERQRQAALATKGQAESAQRQALEGNAPELAPQVYQPALEAQQQGNEHFAAEAYEQAGQQYTQAQEGFARALREAVQERQRRQAAAKEQAEATRRRIDEIRQQLQPLQEWWGQAQAHATEHERLADQAWQAGQYEQAAAGYEQGWRAYEAALSEAQARQRTYQAAVAARTQAEQARQAAEAVQAPHYTPELVTQALTPHSQGEQQFQEMAWEAATDSFRQARALFARAQQQAKEAKEKARQAAEAARTVAGEAQQAAAEGATLFRQRWQETEALQQQAAQALAIEQYATARQLFTESAARFQQLAQAVQEHKQREALKRDAAVARTQAETAKQQALADEADKLATDTFPRADQHFQQAITALQSDRFAQARTLFEEARQQYDTARQQAQVERRRRAALAAREQAEAARRQAVDGGAPELAQTVYQPALNAYQQGQRQFDAGVYDQAEEQYTQAQERFVRSLREAEHERQRREAAAKEQARQAAAAARKQTADARTQAEQAGAQERLSQEFAQAQQLSTQGHDCEERQEFAQALTFYQQATQRFAKLKQEAVLLAARERAEEVRQRVIDLKEVLAPLKPWAGAKWQEAAAREVEAERAWVKQQYAVAVGHYQQVARHYEEARQEAETARQRQQALETKEQAAQEWALARDTEAQQYAASLYQQATDSQQRGEQHLGAQQWVQAEAAFLQAKQIFTQARESAQHTKARQAAAEAREKALQAQQEAADGAALFATQTGEAAKILMEANRALAREDFIAAKTHFARSTALFQEIRQATVLHRQKEHAEHAQERARELHNSTLTVKGWRKQRADKALEAADRLFEQGKYEEAQAQYQAASSLFENLVASSTGSGPAASPWVFALARNPAFLFSTSVLVLLGFYFSGVFPSRRDPAAPGDSSSASSLSKINGPEKAEAKTRGTTSPQPAQPAKREPAEPAVEGSSPPPQLSDTSSPSRSEEAMQLSNPPAAVAPDQLAAVTPPPPSPPPLREPPRLTQGTPSPREVLIEEGKSLNFTIEADSPQKEQLRYAWFLDGKKQSDGNKKIWTYKPDFDAGGEKPKEVRVEVTNAANLTAKQTWSVRVQDVPHIVQFSPPTPSLEVMKGEGPNFSVQATGSGKEDNRLAYTYVWSLDGQEVSRGPNKSWQLPTTISDAPHRVSVSVEDRGGKSDQMAWNVTITRPTPRIVAFRPQQEKLRINAGEPLDLSVTAALPGGSDEAKKKLSYQWKINDAGPQRTDTGIFHFPEAKPGTYQVTVVAISPDGVQSPEKRWTVEVAFVPPPPPPTPPSGITEADVMKWLETCQQAFAKKDVNQLVKLGMVDSKAAQQTTAALDNYKSYSVELKNPIIKLEGNQATVTYIRIDTIDERKSPAVTLTHVLQKEADGHLVRRQ